MDGEMNVMEAMQSRLMVGVSKLCGVVQGMKLMNFYIRQGGHHVGHRPTF